MLGVALRVWVVANVLIMCGSRTIFRCLEIQIYNDMVYNTIIFSDEAANVASKVMNEYDVHVTLILCVSAIIIVAIVCHAIKVVNSNKKQETIKAILEDMLKNDSKIIDTIKKIQGGDKSNLNQDTDAGK